MNDNVDAIFIVADFVRYLEDNLTTDEARDLLTLVIEHESVLGSQSKLADVADAARRSLDDLRELGVE